MGVPLFDDQDPIWKNISVDAQRFIQSLMAINPSMRPTAVQALEFPWIQRHTNPAFARCVHGWRLPTVAVSMCCWAPRTSLLTAESHHACSRSTSVASWASLSSSREGSPCSLPGAGAGADADAVVRGPTGALDPAISSDSSMSPLPIPVHDMLCPDIVK